MKSLLTRLQQVSRKIKQVFPETTENIVVQWRIDKARLQPYGRTNPYSKHGERRTQYSFYYD